MGDCVFLINVVEPSAFSQLVLSKAPPTAPLAGRAGAGPVLRPPGALPGVEWDCVPLPLHAGDGL